MNVQDTVNRFAALAKPRLDALLRLKSVRHIHDAGPGSLNSSIADAGVQIAVNRRKRATQPYRDIERFLTDEKIGPFIIDAGILPIVTALSKDILGKKTLVTRPLAREEMEADAAAYVEGYGVRVTLYRDLESGDTIVAWDCLYGVA